MDKSTFDFGRNYNFKLGKNTFNRGQNYFHPRKNKFNQRQNYFNLGKYTFDPGQTYFSLGKNTFDQRRNYETKHEKMYGVSHRTVTFQPQFNLSSRALNVWIGMISVHLDVTSQDFRAGSRGFPLSQHPFFSFC